MENSKFAVGGNGVDYATTGTVTPTNDKKRWVGLVVNTDAVIDTALFKDHNGTSVTYAPNWFDVTLSQGAFIAFGFVNGVEVYCTSITVTSGSVLLYKD
jgi:hypothetical protein